MARTKMAASAAHKHLIALLHGGGGGATTAAPPTTPKPPHAQASPTVHRRAPPAARLAGARAAVVVDVDGALLLSGSLFPYFMLVALEAGGLLRGLALLLLSPAIACLAAAGAAGREVAVRAMAAVAFCGLRASRFRAGRAVLPRWLLEDVAAEAFAAAAGGGGSPAARVVWASAMPRVMVEPFLREYLLVPPAAAVAAREMRTAWGFYTGLMEGYDGGRGGEAVGGGDGDGDVLGFSGGSMEFLRSPLASLCKEVYVVTAEEKRTWRRLPRRDYPAPLVFHDGRLAFLPTPLAAVAMFTWLPFGAALAAARLAAALALPYRHATVLLAATGQSWRLRGAPPPPPPPPPSRHGAAGAAGAGELYACNHRTLMDPVYVSIALDRPVRAVSYSLSRVSDRISPIGATVRLARDRARDGAAMARLLAGGASVVVCPEGTTCREPYLLRFSPLFAELGGAAGVVPVALAAETAMFYGTTAGGCKAADPFFCLCNPRMCYTVEFLGRVDTAPVAEGTAASTDVANRVQRRLAAALGYECTMLTRKDKYRMLAGNDGAVAHAAAAK
ncbi:hypothetical protein ACP4OV_023237 [Aristida adscensionis]